MDQVTEKEVKKQDEYNHAIRGNLVEVGGMDNAHNVEENNPNSEKSRKKREEEQQFFHMAIEIQEAYNALMDRLNDELETLRNTIDQIETDMERNRLIWDAEIEILNDIDDLFCDLGNGGQLDCKKVQEVILEVGYDVPGDATDAHLITLLQDIRKDKLQSVETLDNDYFILEQNHTQFRAREKEVITAKQRLKEIGTDKTLNDDQKLAAIENLRQDVGSKTLHAAGTIIQGNEAVSKADKVIDKDIELDQSDKSVSVTGSLNTLNF